jgi:uncharacterized protein (TIGR03067 family)
MKKLSNLIMILLLAGLVTHGCGRSENTTISDQELLQGVWVGQNVDMQVEYKMIISGNNFDFGFEGTDFDVWYKGTFVLNEEVTPKQGDFMITDCSMDQYKGTIAKAIYKIENDTFTFAGQEPGVDFRPTIFEASGEIQVFTLKRQAEN